MYKLEEIRSLTLGTEAETVRINGLSCLIENNSASATVYFKERRDDGADVTAENGWALGPGERTAVPLTALELSLCSGAGNTDVRVMILEEL